MEAFAGMKINNENACLHVAYVVIMQGRQAIK